MTLIGDTLREAVARRAGNRCEYCRLSQQWQVATFPIDHILPVCCGGLTNLENLAMACPRCNARKWIHIEALDDTGQLTPLFNPRTQDWTVHFRWSNADPTVIEPLTSIGRATVMFLDLNSSRHLAIRSLLKSLDLHPPREP